MRLTLAVPDLLALDRAALAAVPSLTRLAHFAGPPITRRGTLDAMLAAQWSHSEADATAPLAALGAGFDPEATYLLRADPVSLVAGRTDVILASRIDDLDVYETRALLATLDAHFGGDGLAFRAPRPDAWFVLTNVAPELATTPLSVVRGAIFPWLPTGKDAGQWRRWLSEMQMLLHEHPVNIEREAAGKIPVTGIWISDGGRLPEGIPVPAATMYAIRDAAGDVARGLAQRSGTTADAPPTNFAALSMQGSATVVLDRASAANVSVLQSNWLGPAVAALERGALESLSLLVDGQGTAAAWNAPRPTWHRRVMAKFANRAFVPPSTEPDDA